MPKTFDPTAAEQLRFLHAQLVDEVEGAADAVEARDRDALAEHLEAAAHTAFLLGDALEAAGVAGCVAVEEVCDGR